MVGRLILLLLASMQAASVRGQNPKYPPLGEYIEYMMTPDAKVALARLRHPKTSRRMLRSRYLQSRDTKSPPKVTTASCA
jgi:hypothetical protein